MEAMVIVGRGQLQENLSIAGSGSDDCENGRRVAGWQRWSGFGVSSMMS